IKEINFPDSLTEKKRIAVMTSVLGEKALQKFADSLNNVAQLELDFKVVKNSFFGESVTVTGLLTAQDLKTEIKKIKFGKYDKIFIPDIVLNDQLKFLDEVKKEDFLDELSEYKIEFVSNIKEFMEVIKNG
ncbi:MAG: DUF512 domain-containing protein, partial [Halanaerobiales bacterium]|nr:DUF512 domain-containing protein [Halanaerobiales bacterium]